MTFSTLKLILLIFSLLVKLILFILFKLFKLLISFNISFFPFSFLVKLSFIIKGSGKLLLILPQLLLLLKEGIFSLFSFLVDTSKSFVLDCVFIIFISELREKFSLFSTKVLQVLIVGVGVNSSISFKSFFFEDLFSSKILENIVSSS